MTLKRGRHTLLTPDVQTAICDCLRQGYTLGSAARAAGITRRTLFNWLRRGNRDRAGVYAGFVSAVDNARKPRLQAQPRTLRRAVTERRDPPERVRVMAYREVMRVFEEGRVPEEIAHEVVQMALAEIEDRRAEASLSWSGDYEPWRRN